MKTTDNSVVSSNAAVLRMHKVSKTFPVQEEPVLALREISLEVVGGEFVAVRGPSGSGKTTLLLICGALMRPNAGGKVFFGGRDIYAMRGEERGKLRAGKIGFVFQQYHLLPYLDVLDNVLAPTFACTIKGARKRARELLDRLGISHREKHLPAELSAGEKQRAAFARALLPEPDLVLADEPTGNLDNENAAELLVVLKEFRASGGAVLMATHDESAAAAADRSVELQTEKPS